MHVIRRKAVKGTLRAADDSTLVEPAQLARLLSGIDEGQFRVRFGIDREDLIRGGESLVQGGGELGTALFAAGAGLADVGAVQDKLGKDADELFQPRGTKNPRINKGLSELDEARRRRKESQLRPADWTRQMDQLRSDQRDKAALDARLVETRAARERSQRVRQALPLAAKRQHLTAELEAVGDAPHLAAEFVEQRRDTQRSLEAAQRALHETTTALARIDADLQELVVSDAMLGSAPLIRQLNQGLGAYQKAARDRPRLVGQRDQAEEQAREILRELGREVRLDEAAALPITRAQKARIADLSDRRQKLMTGIEVAQRRLTDLTNELDIALAQLYHMPPPPDVDELRRAIDRAQRAVDAEQRCAQAEVELARLQRQVDADLQRLQLWSGPLESLPALPLPAMETVDRFEAELAELDTDLRTLARDSAELQARALELDSQTEKLRLSQDALTEDDLEAARRRRETGWALVKRAWLEGNSGGASDGVSDGAAGGDQNADLLQAFLADFQPSRDLAAAYALSVERADGVADRWRRESARVAEKAQLMAERRKVDERLAALTGQQAARQQQREERLDQWRGCWQAAGIEPLSPREMRGWLQRHAALAGRAAEIRTRRDEFVQLTARIDTHCGEVRQELEKIGEPGRTGESLSDLLDRAQRIAGRLDADRDERKQAAQQLERLEKQRPRTEQEAGAAREQLARWQDEWAGAVAVLNLPPDASPGMAHAVTATLDSLREKLKDAARLRERIEGIDAEAEAFEQRVRQICSDVGLDAEPLTPEQAVLELAARLQQTQEAQTRVHELSQQRQRDERRRQDAAAEIAAANSRLAMLCREAGCAMPDDLPAIEQRSQQRAECERQLRDVADHLLNLAAGASLEDLLADAARHDAAELDARLAQLAADESDLESQRERLTAQIARQQEALRQMDGGDRAAEAEEQMQSLLARIRGDAEQYIRLRLAGMLLKRAIDRYREKSQGPVLQRASRTFADLTLGSFSGLRADYDDRGNPVWGGGRPDRRTPWGVRAMSDGTRDQLYLALRTASLEHHLDTHPPLPFIVDDILVQFDDARAAAALQVLADLSDRTQVIFFTHHQHLIDIARQHVAEHKLFVHRLTTH